MFQFGSLGALFVGVSPQKPLPVVMGLVATEIRSIFLRRNNMYKDHAYSCYCRKRQV